jgi:hypothetical protein
MQKTFLILLLLFQLPTPSSLYQDASVKTAIDGALGHWLEKRYQNPNWWHNAIGIPRLMQDIIVLLRRDLTREQFEQAMEVLGQHKVRGTGANLVWSADAYVLPVAPHRQWSDHRHEQSAAHTPRHVSG